MLINKKPLIYVPAALFLWRPVQLSLIFLNGSDILRIYRIIEKQLNDAYFQQNSSEMGVQRLLKRSSNMIISYFIASLIAASKLICSVSPSVYLIPIPSY